MTLRLVTAAGNLTLGDPPTSNLACLRCNRPAQLVVDSPGGLLSVCAECVEHIIGESTTRSAPHVTATHWRQVARDYGWPGDVGLVVELWAPHEQDVPAPWLDRFTYIPEFERRLALQREQDQ